MPPYSLGQRPEETLSGPDSHDTGQGSYGHLFGEWGGVRTRLANRGVRFDFQHVSDSLGNIAGEKDDRFASWNGFRWTVDIDFGALVDQPGLYLHARARNLAEVYGWPVGRLEARAGSRWLVLKR